MLPLANENVNGSTWTSEKIQEKISYLHGLIDQGYWIFPLHGLSFVDGKPVCGCDEGVNCCARASMLRASGPSRSTPPTPNRGEQSSGGARQWPDRGWGLHVGLSGLAVLDVDPRNGGNSSLDKLLQDLDLQFGRPHVKTGGEGFHFYFRARPKRTVCTAIGVRTVTRGARSSWEMVWNYSSGSISWCCRSRPTKRAVAGTPRRLLGNLGSCQRPLVFHLAQMEIFNAEKTSNAETEAVPSLDPRPRPADGQSLASDPLDALARGFAKGMGLILREWTQSYLQHHRYPHCGFALNVADAWPLIADWNERCSPHWSHGDLRDIVDWALHIRQVNAAASWKGKRLHSTDLR